MVALVIAALSLAVAGVGCATPALIDSARVYDPPVRDLVAAYKSDDHVLIDFVVSGQVIVNRKQEHVSSRHWAECRRPYPMKPEFVECRVHRKQLDPATLIGWQEVTTHNLSSLVPPASGQSRTFDTYVDYAKRMPDSGGPQLFYVTRQNDSFPWTRVEARDLALLSRGPSGPIVEPFQAQLASHYIPLRNYPLLLLGLPFALVLDVVYAFGSAP